ncbi:MAG: RluA family pseudouridine synthase [Neisseriales bacterium]|nr:MAG: RluA family pseudouridine synthase [Neisseriales bacterium]
MPELTNQITLKIPADYRKQRLDIVLSQLLPQYSRSCLSDWIVRRQVWINGQNAKPKTKVLGGEAVVLCPILDMREKPWQSEQMALDIVYEDAALIVVNKPANLVVYPAAGNWSGTLLNGLLFRYPELNTVPRAGIVHRLDKGTSGLMVVARTIQAQVDLVRQMQARQVTRIYHAVVQGNWICHQVIDKPIGRDPRNRLRMATLTFGGKPSITHVHALEHYAAHSYVACQLETGRTHQIRVHLRSIGHPIVGDPVYGVRSPTTEPIKQASVFLRRQALHACQLSLRHPYCQKTLSWQVPLPEDIATLLTLLRQHHNAY